MTTPLVPTTTEDFIAEELDRGEVDFHAYFTHRARANELTAQAYRSEARALRIWGDQKNADAYLELAHSYEGMAAANRERAAQEIGK